MKHRFYYNFLLRGYEIYRNQSNNDDIVIIVFQAFVLHLVLKSNRLLCPVAF